MKSSFKDHILWYSFVLTKSHIEDIYNTKLPKNNYEKKIVKKYRKLGEYTNVYFFLGKNWEFRYSNIKLIQDNTDGEILEYIV